MYLSRFNLTLKYVSGTRMEKTNRLSRKLDWKIETKNNNNNQILIKEQWIHNLSEVIIEGPEVDIIKKVKIARSKKKEVVKVAEEIKKAEVKVLREDKWQIERNLVLKEGKVYVLKDEKLRMEIIWLHYNVPVAGHKER